MKKYIFLVMAVLWAGTVLAAPNWKAVLRYDKQTAKADLLKRLQKYAAQPAQNPKQQLAFAKLLAKELKQAGAAQVQLLPDGTITAQLPATSAKPTARVLLAAQYDGPAAPVRLQAKYTGGNLVLQKDPLLQLTEHDQPQLLRQHGHDLLLPASATSFGAGSKTGVAILLTLADYLLGHPAVEHGPVQLLLRPADGPVSGLDLPADYAYVLDGADLGEITTENFSGKDFTAVFEGRRDIPSGQAMHSPFADNILMASDFHTLLPRQRRPETTAGTHGFITVTDMITTGDRTTVSGQIRAFTPQEMQELTALVQQAFQTVQAMNPKRTGAELQFQDRFQNAAPLPPLLLRTLQNALQTEDITPKTVSVRGPTAAAALSQHGLPAAGVFTGAYVSGPNREYADVDVMEASLRALLSLLSAWTGQTAPEK